MNFFKRIFLVLLFLTLSCGFCFAKDERIGVGYTIRHDWAGIYVVYIDGNILKDRLKPVVDYKTPTELMAEGKYELIVNGGFFDMKNQKPVSYVVIDGVEVETPYDNEILIENLKKQNRLESVLNRSELRILENENGNIKFQIALHNDEPINGYKIKHSIQGGPQVLPDLKLEEESFIQYDKEGKVLFESASALKRRPRTIVGIDKKDNLVIVVYTKHSRVALNEVQDFLKKTLKLKTAMGFDGGGSTSLFYQDIKLISEGRDGRAVKSFLVIEGEEDE